MASSSGDICAAPLIALSRFLLQAGLVKEERNAVAEAIPAFCKKERRVEGIERFV